MNWGRKVGISALKEMFKEEEGKGDVENGGIDHWFDAVCCVA